MVRPHALRDDDPHRLTCPVGHSDWQPINGHFWCRQCDRHWGRDGAFERVHDRKTGARLDRSAVRELERALADEPEGAV